jgi:uncharacterized membrane protein SpoIIM required for sporulation
MVLEHLFPEDWIEKKSGYAFLLAIGYSIIGIIISRLIFGSNSGIVSVFFVSLFLVPTMRKMFYYEDTIEEKEKNFSFKHLLMDNKELIKTYLMIFLGIFLTYTFFSFVLPQLGINTFNIFKEQLYLDVNLKGQAISFTSSTFWSIMINNWWVLVACFVLGLIAGDGAIFFITWNASVWGTIFGYRALSASYVANVEPFYYLAIVLSIVIWHVILEGGAYILVGTAGGVISREVIKNSNDVKAFLIYFLIGICLIFFINYMLKMILPSSILIFIMSALSFIFLLSFLIDVFKEKSHKMVFKYNFYLFILGLLVFVIGALVETFVLSNSTILSKIYELSMMYVG